MSASVGANYNVGNDWRAGLSLSHNERAPSIDELFSLGPHGGNVRTYYNPILINAVEATSIILNTADYRALQLPLSIMSVFTIVFGTVCYLLFEYVLED